MPYDYDSIMHYPCKPPKCQTVPPGMESRTVHKNRKLSVGDILQINDMYQCKAPGYTQIGKWGDCRPPGLELDWMDGYLDLDWMDVKNRVNGRVRCELPHEAACQAECDALSTCTGYSFAAVNHCRNLGSGSMMKMCAGCMGQCFLYGPGLDQGLPPWRDNHKLNRMMKALSTTKWQGITTEYPEMGDLAIGDWEEGGEGWSEWVCKRKNTMGAPNSVNTPYPCSDEPGHGCRTRAESECVNPSIVHWCKSLCSAQQPVGTCGPNCVTIRDDLSYTVAKCTNPPAAPSTNDDEDEQGEPDEDEGDEVQDANNSH